MEISKVVYIMNTEIEGSFYRECFPSEVKTLTKVFDRVTKLSMSTGDLINPELLKSINNIFESLKTQPKYSSTVAFNEPEDEFMPRQVNIYTCYGIWRWGSNIVNTHETSNWNRNETDQFITELIRCLENSYLNN